MSNQQQENSSMADAYVLPFEQLRMTDVESVGGKNASLGEMISQLASTGVRVPTGFATTALAFRDFLKHNNLTERIQKRLEDLNIDVIELGSEVRYSQEFEQEGTNVNFLTLLNENEAMVRTYERGVEGETLSCGTGVTACALVMHQLSNNAGQKEIHALGGDLIVRFEKTSKGYENIWLCGPAQLVYKGEWTL